MEKLLVVGVFATACVGIGYIASSLFYVGTLSNFSEIKSGYIAGTNYSFVVEETTYQGYKTFSIQNKLNRIKTPLVGIAMTSLEYVQLVHDGRIYLVIRWPNSFFTGPQQDAYAIWNITNDEAYALSSTTSCHAPKLLGNHLEFQSTNACNNDGLHLHDQTNIELQ